MARRVICISRAFGSGGEEVGRIVAERLGLGYVDEEIVVRAAQKGDVDPADVADAERRKPLLRRILDELAEGAGVEAYAFGGLVPSLADERVLTSEGIRALIRESVEEAAAQGDVVIVAHAASYALAGRDEVLRVFVTASSEIRARRLVEAGGLGEKDAAREVKDSDAARADYLKRFYDIGEELPTHYDLVVSTDRLTAEQAAALVVQAAGA